MVQKNLQRRAFPPEVGNLLIAGVTEAVRAALFWNGVTLEGAGAGRRVDVAGHLLSSEIDKLFRAQGIVGNSLRSVDDEIGVIAETEAIAQWALRRILGNDRGVDARPARISAAIKLGLIRN